MATNTHHHERDYRGFCKALKENPSITFRQYCDDIGANATALYRYISMRRRSSLFFGSHAGAKRYAVILSLACSCRQLGINFGQYIIDMLNAASKLPPTAPQDKWRQLLPDRYKDSNPE